MRLHLHLISDSTGETLDSMAKAGLAQFEGVDALKHYWPMVRAAGHLDRVLDEVARRPGLVLYTLVRGPMRDRLDERCRAMGITAIAALDPVIAGLAQSLGQTTISRPGRQHLMDAAYFARVAAIDYTMQHDDGAHHEDWEEADIVLAGVSRSSKTPTAIYLANRGYKTANIPIVPVSPPPPALFGLVRPLVVGLTSHPERLIAIRRNRLLSIGQAPDTEYVDEEAVVAEIAYARRMFADNGWPVIDVTRRSIEETSAAIINLLQAREDAREGQMAQAGEAA